jgi:hypothetical protein
VYDSSQFALFGNCRPADNVHCQLPLLTPEAAIGCFLFLWIWCELLPVLQLLLSPHIQLLHTFLYSGVLYAEV